MSFKETVIEMRELLLQMSCDLEKAVKGNKTAAQRVRTASIAFSQVAKTFRKESIASEKKMSSPLIKKRR